MNKYTISFADSIRHTPKHPERTAKRSISTSGMNFDVSYQVWTNRAAMARSIRMQEKGPNYNKKWRACVPLTETEGF